MKLYFTLLLLFSFAIGFKTIQRNDEKWANRRSFDLKNEIGNLNFFGKKFMQAINPFGNWAE